tara:strand:+ start:374 stop:808 length:435 start_codon:yes stop_codon:yes gene_type:complete
MMMMMMMMLNVNECFLGDTKTKREYIARKHIFSFKVSLFLFFLFFFYFFFSNIERERSFLYREEESALSVIKNSHQNSLTHQYVFGRNARAPFDNGAAAKAKRREEEFVVPVKSSDGDRGGVDVHLRDGDDIRRKDASSSAAGW